MAVGDDLRTLGQADELAYALGGSRTAGRLEQLADVDVARARDMTLARIARAAAAARVLVRRPHVEDRQGLVAEPLHHLLPRRQRLRARLELGLPHRLELDGSFVKLPRPRRHAPDENRDVRMSGEL